MRSTSATPNRASSWRARRHRRRGHLPVERWRRCATPCWAGALSIHEEIDERLPKKKALAIFSSDADQLLGLRDRGDPARPRPRRRRRAVPGLPIAIAIALLLAVVSSATARSASPIPSGGGAYAGRAAQPARLAALVAAGALLVDYVMTVAVSTASAVEQLISAVPGLADCAVEIGVVAIVLITVGNLRGLRESGNIFAIPTYLFVGLGAADDRDRACPDRGHRRERTAPAPLPGAAEPLEPLGLLLLCGRSPRDRSR